MVCSLSRHPHQSSLSTLTPQFNHFEFVVSTFLVVFFYNDSICSKILPMPSNIVSIVSFVTSNVIDRTGAISSTEVGTSSIFICTNAVGTYIKKIPRTLVTRSRKGATHHYRQQQSTVASTSTPNSQQQLHLSLFFFFLAGSADEGDRNFPPLYSKVVLIF